MSYLSTNEAYDYATLACWYQNSIDETIPPIWTDEHLEELLKDFYVIPKDTPTADVVPKSEVDFLRASQNLHEAQFNEIKAELELRNAEIERLKVMIELIELSHDSLSELYKTDTEALVKARKKTEVEVAREIFEDIKFALAQMGISFNDQPILCELEKKYTGVKE